MKPNREPVKVAPNELARQYQRQIGTNSPLEFDELVYLDLITHYTERMMSDEALKVADNGLRQHPYSAKLYLAKAKVLSDLHVYTYALEMLQSAETYQAHMPEVKVQRAKILAGQGLHDDAFAQLDELEDTDDMVLRSQRAVAEAVIFEQLQRYGDMYFFLEQALRDWPGNEEAMNQLWICTELTGRHSQTEQLCEQILDKDCYNSRAWYNLGHARYAQGKTEAALIAFEYAYIIDPRFEFAYREAGEICLEMEQYARAVEVYEVMLEYVSGDNEVMLRLGQCYLHTEAFTQARLCINRVLTRTPDHDIALFYSGLCYAAEQKWGPAVNAYRKALDVNNRSEKYSLALAEALVQSGDYLRAEHYFGRTCELAPEIAEYWLAHANFLIQIGRGMDAFGVLDEAELYTYSPELRYARVPTLMLLGREAEALRQLAETLPEEWESRECLFEIAPELEDHDLVLQVFKCFA